jgi:hypothetical protein
LVANREDVLDVYVRPQDEARPVVGVDEGGKQLIGMEGLLNLVTSPQPD